MSESTNDYIFLTERIVLYVLGLRFCGVNFRSAQFTNKI